MGLYYNQHIRPRSAPTHTLVFTHLSSPPHFQSEIEALISPLLMTILERVSRLMVSEREVSGYLQLMRSMFKAVMGAGAWSREGGGGGQNGFGAGMEGGG